jgi:DNA-binding response OmpR family regulator
MKTILVVDDQPCVRELIMEELGDDGYRVRGAGDRKATWKQLSDNRPDLVILDIYLEDCKGWELLSEIKGKHPDLPILVVTAYDSFADDPRLAKADGYLVKSFDGFESLKSRIASVLGSYGQKSVQSSGAFMEAAKQLV